MSHFTLLQEAEQRIMMSTYATVAIPYNVLYALIKAARALQQVGSCDAHVKSCTDRDGSWVAINDEHFKYVAPAIAYLNKDYTL